MTAWENAGATKLHARSLCSAALPIGQELRRQESPEDLLADHDCGRRRTCASCPSAGALAYEGDSDRVADGDTLLRWITKWMDLRGRVQLHARIW